MKKFIKKVLNFIRLEVRKIKINKQQSLDESPVRSMSSLLQDLKKRGLKCSWILDVGANRSDWSRMAKNIFKEADFCLIEPQVEMTESLQKFCSDFPGSFFIAAGAGAAEETRTLTVWDDLLGSSFLPEANKNLAQNNKQRKIEMITIDNIITQKNKVPQLVKLDIQGFELEALKGASKTFGSTEAFILEVSLFDFDNMGMPVFADVVNFMLERNYVVYDFPGFLRRPLDNALGQCDICFVKKDGFLRASHKWNN